MSITPLASIRRSQYVNWIRVRVTRLWRPKKFQTDSFDGMHYLLVDEKGDAIHAIVDEHDYMHTAKMKEGCLYDIYHVHVKGSGGGYKVVNRDIEIGFNEMSTVIPLTADACPVPKFAYQFVQFHEIEDCFNNQQKMEQEKKRILLADIFGCIKEVVPPHTMFISSRNEHEWICEIIMENRRRETIKITLWSDLARNFDVKVIEKCDSPTFAVFTSLRMKKYKGDITPTGTNHTCIIFNPELPQFTDYSAEFSKPGDKTRINKFYSGQDIDESWKSILELRTLDPTEYKDRAIFCCAKILRFPNHSGWWYNSCSVQRCAKQVKQKTDGSGFFCPVHNDQPSIPAYRVFTTIKDDQDQITVTMIGKQAENMFGYSCLDLLNRREYADLNEIPDEIAAKVGETFLFQMKVGYNNEFVVKNVHLNPTEIEEVGGHSGNTDASEAASPLVTKAGDVTTTIKQPVVTTSNKVSERKRVGVSEQSSSPSSANDKKHKRCGKLGCSNLEMVGAVEKEKMN